MSDFSKLTDWILDPNNHPKFDQNKEDKKSTYYFLVKLCQQGTITNTMTVKEVQDLLLKELTT